MRQLMVPHGLRPTPPGGDCSKGATPASSPHSTMRPPQRLPLPDSPTQPRAAYPRTFLVYGSSENRPSSPRPAP
ncbi:hypothetical protein GPALN_012670 [Globodera pallida]|nr:hypothetical protein GPALN_012670 [Globodera pallida]